MANDNDTNFSSGFIIGTILGLIGGLVLLLSQRRN